MCWLLHQEHLEAIPDISLALHTQDVLDRSGEQKLFRQCGKGDHHGLLKVHEGSDGGGEDDVGAEVGQVARGRNALKALPEPREAAPQLRAQVLPLPRLQSIVQSDDWGGAGSRIDPRWLRRCVSSSSFAPDGTLMQLH